MPEETEPEASENKDEMPTAMVATPCGSALRSVIAQEKTKNKRVSFDPETRFITGEGKREHPASPDDQTLIPKRGANPKGPAILEARMKLYSDQCKAWRNAAILEEEIVHDGTKEEVKQFFDHTEEEHITGVPTKPRGFPILMTNLGKAFRFPDVFEPRDPEEGVADCFTPRTIREKGELSASRERVVKTRPPELVNGQGI